MLEIKQSMSTRIVRYNSTTIAESQDNNTIKQGGFLCQWQRKRYLFSNSHGWENLQKRKILSTILVWKSALTLSLYSWGLQTCLVNWRVLICSQPKKKTRGNRKKRHKVSWHLNLSLRICLCWSVYLSCALQQGPSRTRLWCWCAC